MQSLRSLFSCRVVGHQCDIAGNSPAQSTARSVVIVSQNDQAKAFFLGFKKINDLMIP